MSSFRTKPLTQQNHLSGYLPTLDGWRAIAILGVLLDHATAEYGGIFKSSFFRTGPNGVSLFFAISGFLICSRLLEEDSVRGRISLRDFYIRRACRILPPAFLYLAVIALLAVAHFIVVTPLEWFSCIFFFRNYLPAHDITHGWGGYTIHYWSLAVEEHFYMLWPALLLLAGRLRARYVAAGLAVAVAIWRWWDFHHHIFDKLAPDLLWASRTDIRLDGLLLGCLAALLIANLKNRDWIVGHISFLAWMILVAAYVLSQVLPGKHLYSIWESLILAGIVAWTVLRPQTLVGKVLENRVLKWIGRLSYSLYLWQQLFLIEGGRNLLARMQQFPWGIAMTFLVALLSYKYVERPMIRVGHRFAPPPTPGRSDLGGTS